MMEQVPIRGPTTPADRPATGAPNPDQMLHAAIARVTGGLSPSALATAWLDWSMHLAGSPLRQADLMRSAARGAIGAGIAAFGSFAAPGRNPHPGPQTDTRFRDPAWRQWPFNLWAEWFLIQQDWWQDATSDLRGVAPGHARIVRFAARQALDMMAPANFAATNPVVWQRTQAELGRNVVRGYVNWLDDLAGLLSRRRRPHPRFRVGKTIAATPGEVVLRNRLIELIRYRPTTATVRAEPVLIVPAWIMKYYILDLSAHNSIIAWLRDRGFEVFVISWKNPGAEDADLSMQDYVDLGFRTALDHVAPKGSDMRVHAAGYCLGGTLLALAAAALARDGDTRLATLSLLAAQTDFAGPGELAIYLTESQVAFLEDVMAVRGYLRADQMAGAFRMLRSTDLIWSRVIRHYLLGERTEMNDLMAWNADATRMPARMHAQYLRELFLENRLAQGRFRVDGRPVAIADIDAPIFCVATERDHVSPWRSVHKITLLADADVTFCLTAGGHNGGILSEPGHPRRHHRVAHHEEGDPWLGPDACFDQVAPLEGSWWPAWGDWLDARSGPRRAAAAAAPSALGAAPGTYVFA